MWARGFLRVSRAKCRAVESNVIEREWIGSRNAESSREYATGRPTSV
jgi:hypothetical protein